jgi:sialic acid synthase SpsE
MYITSLEISFNGNWAKANYQPETYESIERTLAIFKDNEFLITDFILISAIKLADMIANKLEKKLDVYLIGFDFDASQKSTVKDFSGHDLDFKDIFLKTQRNHFEYLKRNINIINDRLKLLHVGKQKFSDLTSTDFNQRFKSKTNLETKNKFNNHNEYQELIKKAKKGYVLVVAEFTNNHIGNPERLIQMIKLAKESGADMIKVQKRDVKSFYTEEELQTPYVSPFGKTLFDYRNGVELNDDLFEIIIKECEKQQIVWFASVLDYQSLQYMQKFNPPLIKLPSTISNHKNYLKKVDLEFQRDLVISTGFTDESFETFVLDTFTHERNLFLLQTTSSYPAPIEDCNIGVVGHYNNLKFSKYNNLFPGYSSHDVGSLGCMMAVAAGAVMIEKHVKLGDLDWVHFDGVAIDLLNDGFRNFVDDIRKAQMIKGNSVKSIQKVENHKYKPNTIHN